MRYSVCLFIDPSVLLYELLILPLAFSEIRSTLLVYVSAFTFSYIRVWATVYYTCRKPPPYTKCNEFSITITNFL